MLFANVNIAETYHIYFFSAASCFVELRAWGYDDTQFNGYIRVNGQLKVNSTQPGPPDGPETHTRGINTIVLNVTSCTTSDLRNFDTWVSEDQSRLLVNYLNGLSHGTVLLGASFDDASLRLTSAAIQALASIIGADVTGISYRWKFAFIAVIGRPKSTQFKMNHNFGDNLLMSATITEYSITGNTTKSTILPSNKPFDICYFISVTHELSVQFGRNLTAEFFLPSNCQSMTNNLNSTTVECCLYLDLIFLLYWSFFNIISAAVM